MDEIKPLLQKISDGVTLVLICLAVIIGIMVGVALR